MNAKAIAIVAGLLLGACSASQPATNERPPLAGAKIGAPFTLTNQDGRRVGDRDFAGKWRIVYFGYTFCPDVCPTGLQMLSAGLKAFEKIDPARAAKVVPIFISVDPGRDTPPVLKQFVAAFHPRLVGLTGSGAEVAAVAKAYGVYAAKGKQQPGGGYLVDHSAQAYLMGPDGQPIALLSEEGPPDKIAGELATWVK